MACCTHAGLSNHYVYITYIPLYHFFVQAVARYVFRSGNTLCSGDHVSWHCPLNSKKQCSLRHMLLAEDPQLTHLNTNLGSVKFLQVLWP